MARDLAPDVARLLEDANPYIRKKAAICSIRCGPDVEQRGAERCAAGACARAARPAAPTPVLARTRPRHAPPPHPPLAAAAC